MWPLTILRDWQGSDCDPGFAGGTTKGWGGTEISTSVTCREGAMAPSLGEAGSPALTPARRRKVAGLSESPFFLSVKLDDPHSLFQSSINISNSKNRGAQISFRARVCASPSLGVCPHEELWAGSECPYLVGWQPHRLGLQVFVPPWLLVTCAGMRALWEMTECLGSSAYQVFWKLPLPAQILARRLLCAPGRPREEFCLHVPLCHQFHLPLFSHKKES